MKRFELKDRASGQVFYTYDAEAELPYEMLLAGTPAHEEPVLNPDGTPQQNADGSPVMQTVPATYDVVETDITAEVALRQCWANRVAEYPSLGDQLDAIYKRDHLDEPAQWQAIAAQIDAVKAKYPKP